VNGKNKIFIQTDVKKTDFILKIKKIFFYNDFIHPNLVLYSNNLGEPTDVMKKAFLPGLQ